jgi:integrase
MEIQRRVLKDGAVRWRYRVQTFDRKGDAVTFGAELRRRQQLGTLTEMDMGRLTLADYVVGTWCEAYASQLSPKTWMHYRQLLNKHILPALGPLELRAIRPETIGRWQAERLAAGYGRVSVRYALTLLGAILQRAFENGQIQSNPARAVRKAALPRRTEVRPLAPATIERMRAASSPRDATLISVLAYAGLRPGEALALQWRDVREQTILVERAISLGEEKDTKTAAHRTVRVLQPLAVDLREWRLRSGRPLRELADLPVSDPRAVDTCGVPVVAPASLHARDRGGGARARPSVRPQALVRVAAAPRGALRDLRRPSVRPRRPTHAQHLRPRDGRVRGHAAARRADGDRRRKSGLGRGRILELTQPGKPRAALFPPPQVTNAEGAPGGHQFASRRPFVSSRGQQKWRICRHLRDTMRHEWPTDLLCKQEVAGSIPRLAPPRKGCAPGLRAPGGLRARGRLPDHRSRARGSALPAARGGRIAGGDWRRRPRA